MAITFTSLGSNLALRVLSALLLVPPVLAAIYFGPPYSDLLWLVVAVLLAWEWTRLCGESLRGASGRLAIAAVAAALVAGALGRTSVAGWLVAAGAMAVLVLALRGGRANAAWLAFGVIYAGVPCLALMWLRNGPADGQAIALWVLFLVWATDTGAYVAGRAIGGPKLLPAVSPNKTWAGLLGGMLAAALVGAAVALWRDGWSVAVFAAISTVLAVVAQAGDFFESGIKRHFGVKDSGGLIPGHGGLMDRVDGLLTAGLAVAIVVWLRGASG